MKNDPILWALSLNPVFIAISKQMVEEGIALGKVPWTCSSVIQAEVARLLASNNIYQMEKMEEYIERSRGAESNG